MSVPNPQHTEAEPTMVTEDRLAEWLRAHVGGTIYETDEAASLLHRSFVFTRESDGLVIPRHTLCWALPAASLVGPYPRAVEVAAKLCGLYTVTSAEASDG